MAPRTLTLLNTLGCLALTGLVVAQWCKERMIRGDLTETTRQLGIVRDQAAQETQRRAALERDIVVLKETIEATQKAAETSAHDFAEKDALANGLQTQLTSAREQLAVWEAAIKTRDERIHLLESQLTATRKRLDEAIAKLKAAEEK